MRNQDFYNVIIMKLNMNYKKNVDNTLIAPRNPIYGVSVGQENRLDVTNPHTERFFKNWKIAPLWGFGTG